MNSQYTVYEINNLYKELKKTLPFKLTREGTDYNIKKLSLEKDGIYAYAKGLKIKLYHKQTDNEKIWRMRNG